MPCLLRQSHSAPVPSRNPSQGRGFAKSLLHSLPQHPCHSRLPWHPSQHVCHSIRPNTSAIRIRHHHVLLLPAVIITSSCHLSVQSLHSASTPWRNPSQGRGYAISFRLHSAGHVCLGIRQSRPPAPVPSASPEGTSVRVSFMSSRNPRSSRDA